MGGLKKTASARHSGSIVGLAFVVFLVLKLTGVVDWSWWWVTSPLWLAALATVAALFVAAGIGYLIYRIVKLVRRRLREKSETGSGQG